MSTRVNTHTIHTEENSVLSFNSSMMSGMTDVSDLTNDGPRSTFFKRLKTESQCGCFVDGSDSGTLTSFSGN